MSKNMKLNNLLVAVVGATILGAATQSDAYSVRINGEIYDASAKPTVTIAGAGTDSLDITITGGIDLGSSPAVAVVDPVDNASDPDPVDAGGDPDPVDTTADPDPSFSPDPTDDNAEVTKACSQARVDCSRNDLGPKGNGWSGSDEIEPGTVKSYPFSFADATPGRNQYGFVSKVGKTGANSQGFGLRWWLSALPGGSPIDGKYCARQARENDEFPWNQNKDYAPYCRLPDKAGTLYLNVALCSSDTSDFTCSSSKATFAPSAYKFLISPRVGSY